MLHSFTRKIFETVFVRQKLVKNQLKCIKCISSKIKSSNVQHCASKKKKKITLNLGKEISKNLKFDQKLLKSATSLVRIFSFCFLHPLFLESGGAAVQIKSPHFFDPPTQATLRFDKVSIGYD